MAMTVTIPVVKANTPMTLEMETNGREVRSYMGYGPRKMIFPAPRSYLSYATSLPPLQKGPRY